MQTPNTLNITVGTDVILDVTLEHEGVVLNPALIDDLQANLITGLGRKTPLETSTGIDYIVVNIPWVDGRLPGCYSLEITGSINDLAWSSVGKSIIRYTSATEIGRSTVDVSGDSYDVTMEVGYYYTDSPIEGVNVTVDNGVGTPSATPSYARRVLGIDFHNLKGNGIKNIEQTTISTEDHGVNVVTITDDLDNATNVEIRNGGTGPQGKQGIPGESAIFDPTTGNIAVIEQTTGDSITNPMSQKAVTDELRKADRKIDYGDITSETSILTSANSWTNNRYFNSSGQSKTSSGWKTCADIYVSEYDFVRVSLCDASSVACIIFVDANNQCIVDASIPGAGTSQAPYYREIVVKVPANAFRLGISAMIDEETYGTPYCYGQKMSGGIIKANETREILDKDRFGDVQVVKAPGWVNGYIGSNGQGHLTDDYWLTTPIKADKIYSLRSVAQTPVNLRVNYYDKDMNHLGLVAGGTYFLRLNTVFLLLYTFILRLLT